MTVCQVMLALIIYFMAQPAVTLHLHPSKLTNGSKMQFITSGDATNLVHLIIALLETIFAIYYGSYLL